MTTTNYPLSFDTARCMGMSVQHASQPQAAWCPQRDTCARYVQRSTNLGPYTAHAMWACSEPLSAKIECEVEQCA